ncbi:MAG: cytochrome c-type biogenesis protein [Magnetovibrionaceae bacterium]
MSVKTLIAGILLACLVATPGFAVNPDERLDDPALEQRAREVSKGLRCVVCQNQSIDDSNADLARDMRIVVRERIQAGDSNADVVNYMVSRYGDFVLLKPPVQKNTLILWYGPAGIVIFGLVVVALFYRKGRKEALATEVAKPEALSAEEEARLQRLLDEGDAK